MEWYTQLAYPLFDYAFQTEGRKPIMVGRMDQQTHVGEERWYFGPRSDGRTTRKHPATGA